jgi:hypothetical protein
MKQENDDEQKQETKIIEINPELGEEIIINQLADILCNCYMKKFPEEFDLINDTDKNKTNLNKAA